MGPFHMLPPPAGPEGDVDGLLARMGAFGTLGADGEDLWIEVIRNMDSVYYELVASQTVLEEQNQQLAEARDFTDSVLSAMTDVLVVCDAAGIVREVNRAFAQAMGHAPEALAGQSLFALFAPGDHEDMRHRLLAARRFEGRDWSLTGADGAPVALSVNGAPRHDASGRFDGLVLVGRPIGELQRAYRELDEAHRHLRQTQQRLLASEKMAALGRLVAGVAHELNNPISFVFGNMYALRTYGRAITDYLRALDAGASGEELAGLRRSLRIGKLLADIGPLVDGTLEGAERVRDIVEDLRRFSSNQREPAESFNLVRLVRTAADWVVKAQRIKPRLLFDLPDVLDVVSRKGQLHQILVNLVQNAVDALEGREDGTVTISASIENGEAVMMVADNGPGVPVADQDKIFEPFFTTKPIGSGTGLGLYVSYTIAEKLGGTLVCTALPGGGALFTLKVPEHDCGE